jgi:hypothetical protein
MPVRRRQQASSNGKFIASYLTENQLRNHLGISEESCDPSLLALAITLPMSCFPIDEVHPIARYGTFGDSCCKLRSNTHPRPTFSKSRHVDPLPLYFYSNDTNSHVHRVQKHKFGGKRPSYYYDPHPSQIRRTPNLPSSIDTNLFSKFVLDDRNLFDAPPLSASTVSSDWNLESSPTGPAFGFRIASTFDVSPMSTGEDPFLLAMSYANPLPELNFMADDFFTSSHKSLESGVDEPLPGDPSSAMLSQPFEAGESQSPTQSLCIEPSVDFSNANLFDTTHLLDDTSVVAWRAPPPNQCTTPPEFPCPEAYLSPTTSPCQIDRVVDTFFDELGETVDWDSIEWSFRYPAPCPTDNASPEHLDDMDWLSVSKQDHNQQLQSDLPDLNCLEDRWWRQFEAEMGSFATVTDSFDEPVEGSWGTGGEEDW